MNNPVNLLRSIRSAETLDQLAEVEKNINGGKNLPDRKALSDKSYGYLMEQLLKKLEAL
jgi:hypothetical protein